MLVCVLICMVTLGGSWKVIDSNIICSFRKLSGVCVRFRFVFIFRWGRGEGYGGLLLYLSASAMVMGFDVFLWGFCVEFSFVFFYGLVGGLIDVVFFLCRGLGGKWYVGSWRVDKLLCIKRMFLFIALCL